MRLSELTPSQQQAARLQRIQQNQPAPNSATPAPSTAPSDKPAPSEGILMPIDNVGKVGRGLEVDGHYGVDIPAVEGTRVRAPEDGTIIASGPQPGMKPDSRGGYIELRSTDGKRLHKFFHLSKVPIEVPVVVKQGTGMGQVGNTGLSTGPHLHWELHVNGVPTDPIAAVTKGR